MGSKSEKVKTWGGMHNYKSSQAKPSELDPDNDDAVFFIPH
jgi:hypothetical protein